MQIRILAIGPSDMEGIILEVGKEYPEFDIRYATYHNEEEVVHIVTRLHSDYELILFAGSLPYHMVKNQVLLNKPMFYIAFEGTALYRVLFQLAMDREFHLLDCPINVSIDNLQKYEAEECFEELNIDVQNLYFYENDIDYDIENTVQFHYNLWKNNRIDIAITCVGLVYEKLTELGVHASRIIPTRSAVRNTLEHMLLAGQKKRQQDAQIAVGIIDLRSLRDDNQLTEYQIQRRILALQHILIDYGEKSQSIIKWSDRELKFITTRGALHLDNGKTAENKLLHEIYYKTELRPNLGIGLGHTASEAENRAREALKKAELNNSGWFILDADGTVYGPIGNSVPLSYSIRNQNQELLELAKQARLSSSTINRLLSFFKVHGKDTITTNELANGLGITPRSARRIINKLEKVNLVAITGEEQPVHRGRPRQVFAIQFDRLFNLTNEGK